MSHVTIYWNTRQLKIKTTPAKPLHEVRAEACEKLGLTPPTSYILKRNKAKLDLSLPIRLHNFVPGTRLDLVTAPASATSAKIAITLRVTEPVASQLTGTFPATYTIWQVLRRFEADAREAGNKNVNITERAEPNSTSGQGRLVYIMPAVRMVGRELTGFEELGKTLQELGASQRELLVLRFLKSEMPFEVAVEKIGRLASGEALGDETVASSSKGEDAVKGGVDQTEDVVMSDPPPVEAESSPTNQTPVTESSNSTPGPDPQETTSPLSPPLPSDSPAPSGPKISVYQPSTSAQIAAAQVEVPEEAYEVGIEDVKRMRAKYHELAQPQRLLSDKEIEAKNAAIREEMEKVAVLKIKVRYPDGYTSIQEVPGSSTSQDLYESVRTTLRHPNEPFALVIPPRETIPENTRRLTIDLRLRSGASLHLTWSPYASEKAKNNPALNDELLKAAREMPNPVENVEYGSSHCGGGEGGDGGDAKGKGKERPEKKPKGDIENKLRGFLGLGKGKK
ncbi:hypothetical protein EX30DRAFT_333447 [Ascodesmis nigricans]|uniref:UBX domain-containing protein n=1 Tax=Ascodesmis nigricans TaxID=341454 RepID=A0A4S2MST5_9PEZI|nr:hypothetical protein EX30DRAFT_333447 [Ascodesmis nigricans]